MKEKFNFIRKSEYNQLDWWIKYTQNQLSFYLSNKEDISKTVIFKSVLRSNFLDQLLLITIFLAVLIPSIYGNIRSLILLIKMPFVKELMSFSNDELVQYFKLLSRILAIFSLSLFFLVTVIKRFPNILNFQEINKRIKRLLDYEFSKDFNDENIIESISKKNFNIRNKEDQEIILIKTNLKKYKGFTIKDEETLIKLLHLAMKSSSVDEIKRLCGVAHTFAEAIIFNVECQDERYEIWLNLINKELPVNNETMINRPLYLNKRNPQSLRQKLELLIDHLNDVGLNKVADKIEKELENAIHLNRTKKTR